VKNFEIKSSDDKFFFKFNDWKFDSIPQLIDFYYRSPNVVPFTLESPVLKDYSVLLLQGKPTEGQSLDEVKNLLLQEIDKLRKGDFSDDLIQSIVNNEKKGIIQKLNKLVTSWYRTCCVGHHCRLHNYRAVFARTTTPLLHVLRNSLTHEFFTSRH
jgi:hypothetical protein